MKIKSDFLLHRLGEQYVVVAVGDRSKSFNGIIRLNSTGAFLWEQLSHEKSEEELAELLAGEFETDIPSARKDVSEFVAKLSEGGFLE